MIILQNSIQGILSSHNSNKLIFGKNDAHTCEKAILSNMAWCVRRVL